jgi:hypothetical protein
MAPCSNWKGYLKLSLVSASIAIYPATSSSEKVRFNTLRRLHHNVLAIALANKLARIAWAVLAKGRDFELTRRNETTPQSA